MPPRRVRTSPSPISAAPTPVPLSRRDPPPHQPSRGRQASPRWYNIPPPQWYVLSTPLTLHVSYEPDIAHRTHGRAQPLYTSFKRSAGGLSSWVVALGGTHCWEMMYTICWIVYRPSSMAAAIFSARSARSSPAYRPPHYVYADMTASQSISSAGVRPAEINVNLLLSSDSVPINGKRKCPHG